MQIWGVVVVLRVVGVVVRVVGVLEARVLRARVLGTRVSKSGRHMDARLHKIFHNLRKKFGFRTAVENTLPV